MKWLLLILLIQCCADGFGQTPESDTDDDNVTLQLEDLSQEENAESENDYDLQQLDNLREHPLDINGSNLSALPLLDALLIENLKTYRKLLGDIIDIYELQAVPGFTVGVIKRILPYITIRKDFTSARVAERLTKGGHSFLVRSVITPEVTAGFKATSGSPQKFNGGRAAILMRYKYQYRNLMQYGFLAEKDPGEKLLSSAPFADFTSFHLLAREVGPFRSLAVGDYTINLGQGLIHWQSQAFKKSGSVTNIKRQSECLRPYHSAGEYNFHRGIAATIEKRTWQATVFGSFRKISANTDEDSSGLKVMTSVITSGLHRTSAEREDRNAVTLMAAGANLKKSIKAGHVGLNLVHVRYSLPLLKGDKPYNHYALQGKQFSTASADYNYTYRNFHLFGEFAVNRMFSHALVNGVMATLAPLADVALLYRSIEKSYTSIYGNAFTEATFPANERGFYTGLSLRPSGKWRVDVYADLFSFGWLKYRLDAPSGGAGYLMQLTFRPNRQTEMYTRYRYRLKPLNIDETEDETVPGHELFSNWRTQVNVQLTRSFTIRTRVELCKYDQMFADFPQSGHLFFADFIYKPFGSWWSGTMRFQAFEAENYNTRLYAYENDLLFVSSTPSFYNNGVRYYLNFKAKVRLKHFTNKLLTVSFKAGSTVYTNISTIGTGVSAISGNRNSSLKLQIFLTE